MENQNNVVNEEVIENIETTEQVENVEVKNEKTFTQEELDKILIKNLLNGKRKQKKLNLKLKEGLSLQKLRN